MLSVTSLKSLCLKLLSSILHDPCLSWTCVCLSLHFTILGIWFCCSLGSTWWLITPQQNGVAERKNKTIMNMVCSMLTEKKFPKNFWPEAVNWSVHLLNRSPTLAVKNVTPEEAWSHIKPSVSYFRTTYVHIPDAKRTKLDNKSLKCVFLGVSGEAKAYRLFDPLSKTIIISKDAKFEEECHWDWDNSYEEAIMADLDWDDVHALDSHADNAVLEGDSDVAATSTHEVNMHAGDIDTAADAADEEPIFEGHADIAAPESSVNAGRSVHGVHAETILPTTTESRSEEVRIRRPPRWMQDYIGSEQISEANDFAFFCFVCR